MNGTTSESQAQPGQVENSAGADTRSSTETPTSTRRQSVGAEGSRVRAELAHRVAQRIADRSQVSSGKYRRTRQQPPQGLWLGYRGTTGLEHFRVDQQYSVWMHQHKQLMKSDAKYAIANARFQIQAACVWVLALAVFFVASFVVSTSIALALAALSGAILGGLVMRDEQTRRNRAISHTLPGPSKQKARTAQVDNRSRKTSRSNR